MNVQAFLVRHCLRSYRQANQPGARDRNSVGDWIVWEDSPSRLARFLRARLLSPSTLGINWLALAIAILEARAHA
jgi:hypothetical protein